MQVSYISALRDAIREIMTTDRASILMGMNISSGGIWGESAGLSEVVSRKRLIDTPYSVPSIMGAALGLSMSGAKPVVTVKGEYLLKAADTLANKISVNEYLTDGQFPSDILIVSEIKISANKSVQAVSIYESVFSQFPGLKVIVISSASDVKRMILSAFKENGPVLVLLCTDLLDSNAEENEEEYVFGSSQTLKEGEDVTLITYGTAVGKVMDAAEEAQEKGVSVEVIDLVCISDIDIKAIEESVTKTAKAIVVQDARKNLGIASEVVSKIVESEAFFYLEDRIIRICGKDECVPYSKEDYDSFVPCKEEILDAVLSIGK